ncbi:MAG: hypothetical protein WC718_15815 [Phycisphaerales bacterium]|jgi:hypothetical protein
MAEYSQDDLRLIARVAEGVWFGRGNVDVALSDRPVVYVVNGGFEGYVPDFLADDAAALGLLVKLAADKPISGWGVIWDGDDYLCDICVDGVVIALEHAPDYRRAIVLAVASLLPQAEPSDA